MSESEDKPHDPSQKRLDDARARGEIPQSQDVLTAASYAGFLGAGFAFGPAALLSVAEGATGMLAQADTAARQAMSSGPHLLGAVSADLLLPLLPLFVMPALAVALVLAAMRGVVFAPEKLMPKLSRIDPVAGARHKFGLDGLVEFAKSTLKIIVTGALLFWFLGRHAADLFATVALEPAQGLALMLWLVMQFLLLVFLVSLCFASVDYLWQVLRHRHRNRMSRQEMVEEHKESEGDPHFKQHRRQRGHEIALNRMLRDVETADVVVVNPTHYAVALKWNRARRQAPVCVAKGTDEAAAAIRARAAEHGVPIHRDPPTARAIFATVKLGEPIRPDHYRAVAAAIRFAEAMRKRAKGRR